MYSNYKIWTWPNLSSYESNNYHLKNSTPVRNQPQPPQMHSLFLSFPIKLGNDKKTVARVKDRQEKVHAFQLIYIILINCLTTPTPTLHD
jgi:hypothetical protein